MLTVSKYIIEQEFEYSPNRPLTNDELIKARAPMGRGPDGGIFSLHKWMKPRQPVPKPITPVKSIAPVVPNKE